MNILQLCNKLPYPPKDGGAIAVLNLTKEFAAKGHKVTLLAMNTNKHYYNCDELPQKIKSIAEIYCVNIDTSLNPLDAFLCLLKNKSYNMARFISIPYENKLIELLQKNKYDIIQLEGLSLASYIKIIRQYSSAKIALRAHNVEYKIWKGNAKHAKRFKKVYLTILTKQLKAFEIAQFNKYDCVISITKEDAEDYKKLGCKLPIHICPASFDQNEIKNTINPSSNIPSLFFIGALDWLPNIEGLKWFLHQVWNDIHTKFPNVEFHIAGRNMPEEIKKTNFKNVLIHGEVANAYDFMNKYSIMLVPLFAGSGMRIKIVEGMALKKAIISTTLGAEGIDYTGDKNIMIANTEKEFIAKITECVNNPELVKMIGKNASDFSHHYFSASATANDLIGFYQNTFSLK